MKLRLIALVVLVSLVVVGIVWWQNLPPTIDPILVGTWYLPHGNMTRVYRSDGTYSARSFEGYIRGHRDVEIRTTGTWRYRNDVIYAKCEKQEAFKDGKPFPEIFKLIGSSVGRSGQERIEWRDENSWGPSEVGIGQFQRVASQK